MGGSAPGVVSVVAPPRASTACAENSLELRRDQRFGADRAPGPGMDGRCRSASAGGRCSTRSTSFRLFCRAPRTPMTVGSSRGAGKARAASSTTQQTLGRVVRLCRASAGAGLNVSPGAMRPLRRPSLAVTSLAELVYE